MLHSSRTAMALSSGILLVAASCTSAQHRVVETAPDCRATNGTVSFLFVTIKDDTNAPLPGIHVRATLPADRSGDQTVETDARGRASICLLDGGLWRIDAFGAGFTSLEDNIAAMSGVTCTTTYTMQARQPSSQ